MDVTIAVDAMGGDHGPHVTVPAAVEYLRSNPGDTIVLVGLADVIEAELRALNAVTGPHLLVHAASEVVGMDEPPQQALRNKKDSSMRVAVNLVKSGEAAACISAGNTGALMATGRYVLKMLPGIDRPAIATFLPNVKGQACMLDLGANVDCAAEHLLHFALMGSALASAILHKDNPTVGLLNIGSEEIKGNEVVKQAAELLQQSDLNFYGNVEGDDIFKGATDVVVCDGFVGNVALKISEGMVETVRFLLKETLASTISSQLGALLSRRAFADFKKRLDYSEYGGAPLLGVKGACIVSHGSSNSNAIKNAVRVAAEFANANLNQKIEAGIAETRNGSRNGEVAAAAGAAASPEL